MLAVTAAKSIRPSRRPPHSVGASSTADSHAPTQGNEEEKGD